MTKNPLRDSLSAGRCGPFTFLTYGVMVLALLCTTAANGQTPDEVPPQVVQELRFSDFFKSPLGPKGAEITPTLTDAHGKTMRLTGYMVQQERPTSGHFMLTPRPVRMSEHADGDADDLPVAWAMVYLDSSQQDFVVPYVRGRIEVQGVVSIGRLEEKDGRVSWVRLQLAPNSTRNMNAIEAASYLHSLQHNH